MVKFAHLIPIFPFAAFVINIFFGRRLKKASALIAIAACTASLALSLWTFLGLLKGQGSYPLFDWLIFKDFTLHVGVTIDSLTCAMLLVVTSIGTLIQIYSIGYMSQDPRFSRFFAYLSLFMASMLGLLLADNFLILYMFWEGVGLCSYLLISFWFEKITAAKAGMKAFITTRIGDTGFLIGIFLLFVASRDLSFAGLSHINGNTGLYTAAALLIFCGAIGKSAQFPLHVWLPDAMEGPTPVSALIHAATMVAAGVYLVARCFGLFLTHQPALICVAYIGAITTVLAASIATVNNDIKRILAYSTISQLGFMMLGLGVGGYSAGTFHLMTHAFFKALLFLCAGSIIHSVHTQEIQKMGGIFNKMKVTGTTFIIAGLAISGVPPFSGFWSKDEILTAVFHSGHPALFAAAALTSLLTAFYMFRLIFLVLFGKTRSELHPRESPKTMTIPLIILAVFAIFAGLPGSPLMNNVFQSFIHLKEGHAALEPGPDYFVMSLSTLIALFGIALAYILYIKQNKILPQAVRSRFAPLYQLLSNKYYFDELYDFLFIKPCGRIAKALAGFDLGVIDGAVNKTAEIVVILSKIKAWIDTTIVDGAVNLIAKTVGLFSKELRKIQTGSVQAYLLFAFFGLVLMMLFKLIGG
jgi:NADH-quinone oxidoreductase subunit L